MATTRRTRVAERANDSQGSARDARSAESSRREQAVAESTSPSRRSKADKGSRRGKADKSSRRGKADKSSRRAQAAGKTGKRPAGGERETRRHRRSGSGKLGTILTAIVFVLLVAGVILGLSWPSIQRSSILGRLAEAPDFATAQPICDEFLQYTADDPDQAVHVANAVSARTGPIEAQIYLAKQIGSAKALLTIARRQDTDPQLRSAAVIAAVDLLRGTKPDPKDLGIHSSIILEWIDQPGVEEPNRDLAVAAINLVGITDIDFAGSDAGLILCERVLDTTRPPAVTEAAIDNLAKITDHKNVGYVLQLLKSANADKVIDHGVNPGEPGSLRHRIQQAVTPEVLGTILELLDHQDQRVQATAIGLLKADGLRSIDESRRESIGKLIAAYLNGETRSDKPMIFSEALKSAVALKLTGARNSIIALMPEVPADHEDATAIAQALGSSFIDKEADSKLRCEQIIGALAKAIDSGNPDARSTAARAVQQIRVPGFTQLRYALEAAIRQGTDPECFAAAKHIVSALYGRKDVVDRYGDDLAAWAEFLAQDKPRFDRFAEIEAWYHANRGFTRVSDNQELIKANKERCFIELEELEKWNGAAPLGLENPQIEHLVRELQMFKKSLITSLIGK